MLQIAYAVTEIAVPQVTVQPVAGVVADPPTGCEMRTSLLLLPGAAVAKPPPSAFG